MARSILTSQACPFTPFAKASVPRSSLVFSLITSHACRMCLACRTQQHCIQHANDEWIRTHPGVQFFLRGSAC